MKPRTAKRSKTSQIRVESLGRIAVFLLPSLKLRQVKEAGTHEEIVHRFLMKHFAGYTASAGNIFGYWRDDRNGREYYGEHKEYKVSFRGRDRIEMLEEFLSRLAGALHEDCIYLEYGEDARLVYAGRKRR